MKIKSCKVCKTKFEPTRAIQPCCGYDCNLTYALALTEKKNQRKRINERRETKVKLDKLKSKSEWLKETQTIFNKFIRLRDANNPCISCSRWHTGQYHAGHYRSVGSSPHLRFNEHNCHRQCSVCNNHLSGNQLNYRRGLIEKIGIKEVERLERDNDAKHYTIDDIKAIKEKYKLLIKEIENGN